MDLNKTKKMFLNVFFICMFFSGILPAQVADLELNIEIENIENGVEFGQTGSFVVTITNFGPDDAGITSNSQLPVRASSGIIGHTDDTFVDVAFIQDFSFMENCFFIEIAGSPIPGGEPHSAFVVFFPVIPVGSSVTCHGNYFVGFREGSRTITWRAISGFNQLEIDPNLDNNEVSLFFGVKPQIIPTLNNGFLLLLMSLTLATVYFQFRKRKNNKAL